MSARLRAGRREMKENLCRPGGVISTHSAWPPASARATAKRWSGVQPDMEDHQRDLRDPLFLSLSVPRALAFWTPLGSDTHSPLRPALFIGCGCEDVDEA
ncbi:hypothetical protein SRHO_G00229550 [Serrasalmus rhombeus]